MPPEFTSPGTYVQEVPGGAPAIAGVATSVTAFVGRAVRGQVDEPTDIGSWDHFQERFGGLWSGSRLGFAVRDFFRNGGTAAVVVRVFGGDGAGSTAAVAHDTIELVARAPGGWGNGLRIRVDHDTRTPDPDLDEDDSSLFNLHVRDGTTGVVEEHRDVTVGIAGHPRALTTVLEAESELVRVTAATVAAAARPAAHAGAPAGGNVWDQDGTSTGVGAEGGDGAPLGEADFIGAGREAARTGLYALEGADLFNLLVVPPHTTIDDVEPAVVTAAHAYCARRRAMLVLDGSSAWPPSGPGDRAQIQDEVGTIGANAALFFPRLRQPNPLGGDRIETFPAAGAIAGVMARTDAERGVWKAAAGPGAALTGVSGLSVALTDLEQGPLNQLGVNCLRDFPRTGPVVWGARTGAGADELASEWKYVPVRRTALFIEESLHRGLGWVAFEPNDEPLWSRIRQAVRTFMEDLFRRGAFQGRTSSEAYVVGCDRQTTSEADLDRGVVNVLVGFAALVPREFVMVRLRLTTAG